MAIDTKAKRASVAGLALPFLLGLVPDAAQPQEWRQASAWSYYGIDAAAPAVATPFTGASFRVETTHRAMRIEVTHRPVVIEVEHRKVLEIRV